MSMMFRLRAALPLLLALLLTPIAAWAKDGPVNIEKGFAIEGYDPVAYFTDAKPVAGSAQFEHSWNGATWRFASAEHRDLFAANPAKYAPQYGGYCAYGVSKGGKYPIDPQAWSVIDGKLYLNYDLDVQKTWSKDTKGFIAKADGNWVKLEKE